MENLIGCPVWVVEYNDPGFSDCNGVFSTREKAIASVLADAERCSDIWHNFELEGTEEEARIDDWFTYSFIFDDAIVAVIVYKTFIQ